MKQQNGFTLIELLVVVLIIGVLSSVALPQYQKAVLKSRTAEGWINLKNLKMAAESYCLENPRESVSFSHDPYNGERGTNLSISLSRTKYFDYRVAASCSDVNSGRAYGAKAGYYDGSKSFWLGLNQNGYRSCDGNNCADIGFTKGGSGTEVCALCGGSGGSSLSCYYMD